MSDVLPPKFSFFLQTRVSFQQRFSFYPPIQLFLERNRLPHCFSSLFWNETFVSYLKRTKGFGLVCSLFSGTFKSCEDERDALMSRLSGRKKLQYVQFYKRK